MRKKISTYDDQIYRTFIEHTDKFTQDWKATRNITFQVTDACNLRCTYCYQINKHHNVMPFEVAKKFIDMLLDNDEKINKYVDSSKAEAAVIEFIGGEPFLEIDLIDKISDYFIQACIDRNHRWAWQHRFSICSNGVLYFDPKVQAYMKKHQHDLSFSISIDGNKKLHDACRVFPDGSGSYDIAIAGVKHYMEVLGGYMGSKMTIAPQNIMYIAEAVESLIENNYEDINLNCVFEEGWTEEHAKILYTQLKKLADYVVDNDLQDKIDISIFNNTNYKPMASDDNRNWCGGTGSMISVDWKGDIYPCIRYMESSLGTDQKPLKIGNVYDGVLQTEEEQQINNCLQCITRRSQSTDECWNCPIAQGCAWCSAYNYQVFGTADKRATFICPMHKAESLANVYYWNKVYRKAEEKEAEETGYITIPLKRFKLWLPDEEALKIITQEELDMLHELEGL